jgi:Protein of unknown function (DUF1553)/Protein of unknown function (DUF1549)
MSVKLPIRYPLTKWGGVILLAGWICGPGLLEGSEAPPDDGFDWNQARQFWSFQRPKPQTPPPVKKAGWPQQRLDRFVLARMEAEGIAPAAPAGKRVLIRRLTYILTGLPPSPDDVAAFLADARPDAYERLVDRLLGTPQFGERLASLWLPLARYAEDQAHQVGDDTKNFYPNAYLYRAWVIDAFNRDLPYDDFLKLQLAADLLTGNATNQLPALGFLGLGPKYYNRGRLDVMADEWEDRVDTVARAMQGLTVACARCHDHKFDPIRMEDYYALAGVFASTRMVNRPLADAENGAPGGEEQNAGANQDKDKAKGQGNAKRKNLDPKETMHIVGEGEAKNLHVFLRGNVDNEGPEVPRRFLQILSPSGAVPFREGSGRKELALAIAARDNPLTARVMVNRIWGMMFGRPLVGTPSNFGHQGDRPTHPELLDDLAVRFMDGGWSVKALVREMALSSTFRQKADAGPAAMACDPSNQWLGRMNRRRLTVEMWRDAVLKVAGNLEPEGGPSLELDDPKNLRRTVYARVSRLKLNDVLMEFDYPDANVHSAKRAVTTTPMQKLFVLNSPFMLKQAQALANRLRAEAGSGNQTRIEAAYQLLYARPPSLAEVRLGLDFLRQKTNAAMPRWEQYAQALLAANEMMYVD